MLLLLTIRLFKKLILEHSLEPASAAHPFGFDMQGCDIYARVVYGTRTSLSVGLLATALVVLVGSLIAELWLDSLEDGLMRFLAESPISSWLCQCC